MQRLSSLVVVATATALLAGGCSDPATSPTPTAPVRVTVQQNPTFAGGMAVFSLKVENVGQSVVDLTFPSSCQVLPYFFERSSGREVTPAGGGFVCLTVITRRTLGAGEWFLQTYTVNPGTAPEAQYIVLPPGEYTIRARLEDTVYRLNSDPLVFTVQ
jgi:hypothetical protein